MMGDNRIFINIIALTILLLSGTMCLLLSEGNRSRRVLGYVLFYAFAVGCSDFFFDSSVVAGQLLNPIDLLCVLPISMPMLLCVYGIAYRGVFLMKRMLVLFSPIIFLFFCYVTWFLFSGKIYAIYTLEELWANFFTFDILMRFTMLLMCFMYAVILLLEVRRVSLTRSSRRTLLTAYLVKNLRRMSYLNLGIGVVFIVTQLTQSLSWIVIYRISGTLLLFSMMIVLFKEKTVEIDDDLESTEEEDINESSVRLDGRESFEHFLRVKKPFLDPDLTLPELAMILSTNRTTLSNFIRQEYGKNFSLFINSYRIEEFKRLVDTNVHESISIDGLCADSGFRSRSTFYRCFAELEQMTPSQYISGKGKEVS